MDKLLTMPDLIRGVALTILVEYHPDGIQQVHLRKLVEEKFSPYLDVNEKSNSDRFRNTLSTLDNRYPEYVIKEVVSHKNVVLKPTIELIYAIDDIEPPELSDYFTNLQGDQNVTGDKAEKKETKEVEPNNELISMVEYINNKYPNRFENTRQTLDEIKTLIRKSDLYQINKLQDKQYMVLYLLNSKEEDKNNVVELLTLISHLLKE